MTLSRMREIMSDDWTETLISMLPHTSSFVSLMT